MLTKVYIFIRNFMQESKKDPNKIYVKLSFTSIIDKKFILRNMFFHFTNKEKTHIFSFATIFFQKWLENYEGIKLIFFTIPTFLEKGITMCCALNEKIARFGISSDPCGTPEWAVWVVSKYLVNVFFIV